MFDEVAMRVEESFMKHFQEGVGYDEAKTKCGNSDAQLQDAIQSGRVRQKGEFPFALYFFKRVRIGTTRLYSVQEASKRAYGSTETIHNTMGQVIQSEIGDHVNFAMGGEQPSSRHHATPSMTELLSTTGDGKNVEAPTDETLESLLTRCIEKARQLEKAVGFADKWITANRGNERNSPRFAKALQELRSGCELGDELLTKLNRARKYRKDPDGKPVTCRFMGSLLGEVEAQIRCVAGDFKCAKYHAPNVAHECI